VAWIFLWIGAALFTALPQVGENGLEFMLTTEQAEGAGPLRSMDTGLLRWLTVENMTRLGFAAAAVCVVVGFTVFLGAWPRVFLSLVMLAALVDWVVFQNFGGISTGASTDVGTGPALMLLACAFWPLHAVRARQTEDAPAAAGGVTTAG